MSSSRQQELASRLQHFNAGDQYEVVDIVGEGAYGVVW
jgi:mitogen-activated protein kinase 1/3